MEQKSASTLPFARSLEASPWVQWWAPARSGDDEIDRCMGVQHFHAALSLVSHLTNPSGQNYYVALTAPGPITPCSVFVLILHAMQAAGPMECAFLHELARKAAVGAAPPRRAVTEEDRTAEDHAILCLEICRGYGVSDFIGAELAECINGIYETGNPAAFIWTICAAATAGAMH